MYSNIKQLRKNGVRFKRDGDAGLGVFGELVLIHHNGQPCLTARRWGDASQSNRLLPDLHRAQCMNFHGDGMRWEGYQVECEGGPAYVQEWLVTLISERPPA
ncbi:hypothetical protein [Pseudoduganella violaceinigra]|uniref:hypothetical protein n=1 Tax=Pseudoduganella violaceinigra TaxID=246602 RepID=UPI0012B5B9E9|nr:hypothetical protein [Pseudoduganella violaceinigra]